MGRNHEPHARYAGNISTARPACMQLGDFHCMIRRYCYRAASIQRRRKSHVAGTETKRLMMPLDYRDFADLQSQTMRRVGQVRMFHQLAPHLIFRARIPAPWGNYLDSCCRQAQAREQLFSNRCRTEISPLDAEGQMPMRSQRFSHSGGLTPSRGFQLRL